MIAITYIYFFSLLDLSTRADFVSRRREGDFAANIGMVKIIGKRNERQAIVTVEGIFGFCFWGGVVECSSVDYEPVIKVNIIRECGEGGENGSPVGGDFFLLLFQ